MAYTYAKSWFSRAGLERAMAAPFLVGSFVISIISGFVDIYRGDSVIETVVVMAGIGVALLGTRVLSTKVNGVEISTDHKKET